MSVPAYQRLADDLRDAIGRGEFKPGDTLPRLTDLMARYEVSKATAADAVAVLESQGLVDAVRGRGTVVRVQPARRQLSRHRMVFRGSGGYFFDLASQPLTALGQPEVCWGRAPGDIADLLGIDPGEEVVVREQVLGDAQTGRPVQISTSYLPSGIARGTRLTQAGLAAGEFYDLLEEMRGALRWTEAVGARMPTPAETAVLGLGKGVALLRIVRTAIGPDSVVLEVEESRLSAAEWEVGYDLTRHQSARQQDAGRAPHHAPRRRRRRPG